MTTAQVVKTPVNATSSSFQNNTHMDDHTRPTTDTPGFKPVIIQPNEWHTVHSIPDVRY